MTIFKFVSFSVLIVLLLVLAVQNPQPIAFNFLHWKTVSTSLLVVILASVLVGLLFGFLMGWTSSRPKDGIDDEPPPEE